MYETCIKIFFLILAIQCDTCEVYKACGPVHPAKCGGKCDKTILPPVKCIEGCFCPQNNTVSHNGKCIKEAECSCTLDGIEYQEGAKAVNMKCQTW